MEFSTRRTTVRSNRGAILVFVMGTALVCAIAAFTVLLMAVSNARHARSTRERVKARYLAEAGQVYARERLWTEPAYCPGAPVTLDTDGDGVADTPVAITITNCGPNLRHQIITSVTFF